MALALVSVLLAATAAEPAAAREPPPLAVRSAMLVDAASGAVLYAKNPDRLEPPASLTKMMTIDLALQALEDGRIHLNDRVPVSARAFALAKNRSLSRIFLERRRPVSVEQLFFGLMVASGDDAATALAEYLAAGDATRFVEQMNAHAQALGLGHTHFGDAVGLSRRSVTTARDMAALARHLIHAHPEVLRYSRARYFTYHAIRQPNYNTLLFHDPRVDGLKTGTLHGQYHLLATAEQDGVRLIAVVMGARGKHARARAAEQLLDWGFANHAQTPAPAVSAREPRASSPNPAPAQQAPAATAPPAPSAHPPARRSAASPEAGHLRPRPSGGTLEDFG